METLWSMVGQRQHGHLHSKPFVGVSGDVNGRVHLSGQTTFATARTFHMPCSDVHESNVVGFCLLSSSRPLLLSIQGSIFVSSTTFPVTRPCHDCLALLHTNRDARVINFQWPVLALVAVVSAASTKLGLAADDSKLAKVHR